MRAYIGINGECDCPSCNLVVLCVDFGDGTKMIQYIAEEVGPSLRAPFTTTETITPLEVFGVSVELDPVNPKRLLFTRTKVLSEAKYRDGKPRAFQDPWLPRELGATRSLPIVERAQFVVQTFLLRERFFGERS